MFENLLNKLILLPIVLFSLSLHELSHGFMAYKLGDNTAKAYGRLTLNPMAHLDIFGTISMLFFGFGWAKPVPVNFAQLKYKRLGPVLVAIAGPVSNFLLAFVTMIIYSVCLALNISLHAFVNDYFVNIIVLNVVLASFNLIPIPPLDGSKVVLSLMPYKWQFTVYKYEPYIQLALFGMLYMDVLDPVIWGLSDFALNILNQVGNFIYGIFA